MKMQGHSVHWKNLAPDGTGIPTSCHVIQLFGFGLVIAMTILAAIGDITCFPSAKHLVGYAGLGARVHDSGLTHKTGSITKAGRRDLRGAMIQPARIAAQHDPKWRAQMEHMRAG